METLIVGNSNISLLSDPGLNGNETKLSEEERHQEETSPNGWVGHGSYQGTHVRNTQDNQKILGLMFPIPNVSVHFNPGWEGTWGTVYSCGPFMD